MVKNLSFFFTAIFLLLLISCHLDVIGLFRSDDLEARLVYKNTFNFLRDEDRTLTLEDTFTFIVLTDTHILDRNAHGLERLAEEIIESDAFVVILGDITENGKQEDVERFIEIARTFGIPTFPLIGNHDIYFNTWHIWRDLIGSTSYRINGTNTTLFILDSANAFLGSEQLNWLERELKSASDHVFIFTHANMFVKNIIDVQQHTDIRERARFTSMLAERGTAVFMGHTHRRSIRNAGSVKYINIEDFRSSKVYCRVEVFPEGIRYNFIRMNT